MLSGSLVGDRMVGSDTGWLPTPGGNSGEREAFSRLPAAPMNARSRSLFWELGRRRRRQSGEGGGGEDDIEGGDKASEEQDTDVGHQDQAENRKERCVQENTTSRLVKEEEEGEVVFHMFNIDTLFTFECT